MPSGRRSSAATSRSGEAGVVVQQEGVAQPGRQRLDQVPHVRVLDRVGHGVQVRARRDAAHGPAFPFGPAPVVAYQVGGDHVQVALRAVHLRPPGQEPDEGLGRDLVRGLVVIDQAPHPPGQLGVGRPEQLLGGVGVDIGSRGHRIFVGAALRAPAARQQDHVGAGRGAVHHACVKRQRLPHFPEFPHFSARARPRDVRATAAHRLSCLQTTQIRDDAAARPVARKPSLFSERVQPGPGGYTENSRTSYYSRRARIDGRFGCGPPPLAAAV